MLYILKIRNELCKVKGETVDYLKRVDNQNMSARAFAGVTVFGNINGSCHYALGAIL